MQITCPHCQKSVTIADASAGQPTPCPSCGHIFTAPALMNEPLSGSPAVPSPAPPVPPPESARAPTPEPKADERPMLPLERGFTFKISPRVVRWIGPIALIVLFVLTFFPWVGSYPGGIGAYTQNGWQTMAHGLTTDPVAEEALGFDET